MTAPRSLSREQIAAELDAIRVRVIAAEWHDFNIPWTELENAYGDISCDALQRNFSTVCCATRRRTRTRRRCSLRLAARWGFSPTPLPIGALTCCWWRGRRTCYAGVGGRPVAGVRRHASPIAPDPGNRCPRAPRRCSASSRSARPGCGCARGSARCAPPARGGRSARGRWRSRWGERDRGGAVMAEDVRGFYARLGTTLSALGWYPPPEPGNAA